MPHRECLFVASYYDGNNWGLCLAGIKSHVLKGLFQVFGIVPKLFTQLWLGLYYLYRF